MEIDLRGQWPEMRGMTFDYAREITACAAICLAHHGHGAVIPLQVRGAIDATCLVRWNEAAIREIACYGPARDREVIRRGAECIAICVMDAYFGLEVVMKAEHGTGVDCHNLGKGFAAVIELATPVGIVERSNEP